MKHAQRWSTLVFAMALGVQVQAFAKAGSDRLAQEIAMNDAYTSPYATSTSVATSPSYFGTKSLLKFEPSIGMNMSTYSGASGNYSFEPTTGFSGGIGVLVGRSNLQFETGLFYAERGGKESFKMGNRQWGIDYKNKYIEVPLMARYNFETSKETRLFVKAGAVIAVLQDSRGDVTNTQNYSQSSAMYGNYGYYNGYYNADGIAINDGNTKDSFTATDMRWAAAVGGLIRITRNIAWSLQGDYQTSIQKASDSQPNGYVGTTPFTLKTITYGLNTGVLISL